MHKNSWKWSKDRDELISKDVLIYKETPIDTEDWRTAVEFASSNIPIHKTKKEYHFNNDLTKKITVRLMPIRNVLNKSFTLSLKIMKLVFLLLQRFICKLAPMLLYLYEISKIVQMQAYYGHSPKREDDFCFWTLNMYLPSKKEGSWCSEES